MAVLRLEREQVLAFRLANHNLARRLPSGSLVEAARACGVQNSPPGAAALALHARVDQLRPAEIAEALARDKTILQCRSLRAAPYFFPTEDLAIFTTGLLPVGEDETRFFIRGAGPALDKIGISATEVVERTRVALLDALDGRELAFSDLSATLTERVGRQLSAQQLAGWLSPSMYGPNHCLGEAIVHFALYVIALQGVFCFAPKKGRQSSFVRTDQWLGTPPPRPEPDEARAELLRRYLHCYGPSTVEHFAAWAGIAPETANRSWALLQPALVAVDFDGRRAWLHKKDLALIASPPLPSGVRLLPPHDPYLAQRDRETVLPDKKMARLVWRTTGSPGVVLADGHLVALWRARKQGRLLVVTITPLNALSARTRADIAEEAASLAPFRGAQVVKVDSLA